MMSEAHSNQLEILVGFIVFLFVAIIGTIVLSQIKRKKASTANLPQPSEKNSELDKAIEAGVNKTLTVDVDKGLSEKAFEPAIAEVKKSEALQPSAHTEEKGTVPTTETESVELKKALRKTEENIFGRIKGLFGKSQIQESYIDDIEEVLYTSDLGPATVQRLMSALDEKLSRSDKQNFEKIKETLKEEIKNIFKDTPQLSQDGGLLSRLTWAESGPTVLMIVGVNGAGKTTSIGKISALLAQSGKKVLVAAGDTFRAAAGGQLKVWTDRAQVEIFSPEGVTDPSAVAFDAISKAKAGAYDVVIVDTAGRLHTQANLMEELKKMKRVMTKVVVDAPHETLIVLDANSGQNALMQAKEFHNALTLTGAIFTKMDGSAKGGVAIGLAQEIRIPIKFIGVGEKIEDLRSFDYQEFVDSIVG